MTCLVFLLLGLSGCCALPAPHGAQSAPSTWAEDLEAALLDGTAEDRGFTREGDILIPPPPPKDDVERAGNGTIRLGNDTIFLRNAVTDPNLLWPKGVVPIALAAGEWSESDRDLLFDALEDLMSETCVRFVPWRGERDYLLLRNTGHQCASVVGFHPGSGGLPLFLGGGGCHRRGTIQHEMLHTLGIWHEHTRRDRDEHVTVVWNNILPGRVSNFKKRPLGTVQSLGLPYDYASVMHYRARAFSKDGMSITLLPMRTDAIPILGQRIRFSPLDIAKVNILYNCAPQYYRAANTNEATGGVAPEGRRGPPPGPQGPPPERPGPPPEFRRPPLGPLGSLYSRLRAPVS